HGGAMELLEPRRAFSGFAVPDLEAARRFYGDTLGLPVSERDGLLALHIGGGEDVLVYPKPDHVPATYTILNFPVDDIGQVVDALASRGVEFLRYCSEEHTSEIQSRENLVCRLLLEKR